jgi:RNA polymerase sigma-70 factor (ECF subfamily)
MKTNLALALATVAAFTLLSPCRLLAQEIDSMPPVVVKTVPESGAKDVQAGEVEIKVTFSKEMRNGSWSWSTAWQNSTPDSIGKPVYLDDNKTCVLKVKLEPGKTYGWWINSQKFGNFKDTSGRSAVPYLLVFKVKTD